MLPEVSGYVELHMHSNYSLLEGASHPEELIAQAVEFGYDTLALTDHDNLHAALSFGLSCKRAGIRAITGLELTYAVDPETCDARSLSHITLLAVNRQGYASLCRLASLAHGQHLKAQRDRDQRRRDPCLPRDLLAEHASGLICLSGCRQGELARLVDANEPNAALATLQEFREWFGADNLYVELQNNLVAGDRERIDKLVKIADELSIKTVATGNVHYHVRERHRLQDALVAIKNRSTLVASHQWRRPNSEFAMRAPAAQLKRFARWPEAVVNSREIAKRCEFDITADLGYRLPTPALPGGRTPDEHLAELCHQAMGKRYPELELAAAQGRLTEELQLIRKHGLAGFFLIYHEVMQLAEAVASEVRGGSARARVHLPPGRGRGSSVGSIVCYLIGLSHVDPVRNKLFLGRFLNDEMQSLPDIDLDLPRDIRAKLFERVYEHWGKDHAAIVGLFPTYRIRSAIRDLGKTLGLPLRELDRLAKFAQGYGSAKHLAEEMQALPQFADLVNKPGWRELIELAHELADFPRHLSQHVGGVVIASEPLIDCVPIEPAAWPGRYICHWDKDSIDDARMVKIDFLGLGMLSLVEECIDHIAEQRGEYVDLARIDINDRRVYDRICSGDTIGVFQIESRAQAQMLPRSRPRNLDDLAAQVAIVRPGPIVGGAVHPYLERRQRLRQDPSYVAEVPHELLRDCLGETLGVVIYQEQVVQCAMALAGFTTGEAEAFRRAMGRRNWPREQPGFRERFLAGTRNKGVASAVAEQVFENLTGFAEFGFPKSHATAFAVLAYQSAWLKEFYSAEFYAALLNSWPMGFYPPHVVINDAQRHGVAVRSPDINRSLTACSLEDTKTIRLGLRFVKDLGSAAADHVVAERNGNGPYQSLFDAMQRCGLPRQALENLVQVGAFQDYGLNRRELLWQLGLFKPESDAPWRRLNLQLQLELESASANLKLPDLDAYGRMTADYSVLGLSPSSHPMAFLRAELEGTFKRSSVINDLPARTIVDAAGLVVCRQSPMTAKGIVFLTLEDEEGLINILIPKQLYQQERRIVRTSAFVKLRAVIEARNGVLPLLKALTINQLIPKRPLLTPVGRSWS